MIQSMTGYGKAEKSQEGKSLKAEIRSLNSKFLDLNLRLPYSFKDKEIEVRNLVTEKVQRGKVDLFIIVENGAAEKNISFNRELAKRYYNELKSLAKELDAEKKNLLQIVMQIPDVVTPEKSEVTNEEWNELLMIINSAVDDLNEFRKREGAELEKALREHVTAVLSLLHRIEEFEKERMEAVKKRLRNQLTELVSTEEYDRNRFEQELIYHMERIDFTEEKVRLRSHCEFFRKNDNRRKREQWQKIELYFPGDGP
jgi:uncharacterized protein (TIGR00255 family)